MPRRALSQVNAAAPAAVQASPVSKIISNPLPQPSPKTMQPLLQQPPQQPPQQPQQPPPQQQQQQLLQQPQFGKLSMVGKHMPAVAAPYHHHQNLHWTTDQTSEFFTSHYVQEAQRAAAWQQYYQYTCYMQATMTPEQFQQWQLSQHYQYQHQQMYGMQAPRPKQQKPRKPRVKKDAEVPAASQAAEMREEAMPLPAAEVDTPSEDQSLTLPIAVNEATSSEDNKYEEMKRAQLMELCKERGLKANGKNTDLIKVLPMLIFS